MSRRGWLAGSGLAAAALAVGGCSKFALLNAVAPDDGVVRETGLAYGPHPRQRLDLYRPAGQASRPLPMVLFLYGGSWRRGSREHYRFAGQALARRGLEVAVADYRLHPEVVFPTFVEDGARAAVWLARHGDRPVHLVGHSAGAHIAALIALDSRYLAAAEGMPEMIGRWVGLAGPYAFHPFAVESVRPVFDHLEDEAPARPITFVESTAPPALLLHGAEDSTVDPRNSQALAEALREAGVRSAAHLYPDVGHVEILLALTPPFIHLAPTLEDTARFLLEGTLPTA